MYYRIDFNQIPKICSFGYEHLSKKRKHPTRTVKEYILYIVTAGELHILLNGEDLYLHKGDGMLFHPSETQASVGISDCEYFWCHFESDTVTHLDITDEECAERIQERRLLSRGVGLYTTEAYAYCYVYLKKRFHIRDAALYDRVAFAFKKKPFTPEARDPEHRFHLSVALSDLLFRLEDCEKTDETHYMAHKLVKFIERNYDRNVSSEEIEATFSLGIDHLNRIFKKAVGTSIVKYRNSLRIEKAKAALSKESVPLSEVAFEAGFENYPYFSRLFKRETGLSPEKYRKQENRGKE